MAPASARNTPRFIRGSPKPLAGVSALRGLWYIGIGRHFRTARWGPACPWGVSQVSRWKASGVHLLISIGIALLFVSLMLLFWYPRTYFEASGGDRLLAILISVDVVLGPLLTLIVFKAGKKHLKFDLAVIALCQVAALFYGASVVWQARPVFIVFAVDRFSLVAANELDEQDLAAAPYEQFQSLPWTGPRLVAARRASEVEERNAVMWSALLGGKDIDRMPRYYEPYEAQAQQAVQRGRDLKALINGDDERKRLIEEAGGKFRRRLEQLAYLPLVARKFDMAMLIDRATGQPLTAVPLDPW